MNSMWLRMALPIVIIAIACMGYGQAGSINPNPKCQASSATLTMTVDISKFGKIASLLDKIEDIVKKIPIVARFKLKPAAEISVIKGQECCSELGAPVEYLEGQGTIKLSTDVEIKIPGIGGHQEFSFVSSPTSIVEYEFRGVVDYGPGIAVSPNISSTVSGRYSDCGICVGLNMVSVSLPFELNAKAMAGLSGRVFEKGHWYTIDAGLEVQASIGARSKAEAIIHGLKVGNKEGCLSVISGELSVGQIELFISAKFEVGAGVTKFELSPEWSTVVYDGYEKHLP